MGKFTLGLLRTHNVPLLGTAFLILFWIGALGQPAAPDGSAVPLSDSELKLLIGSQTTGFDCSFLTGCNDNNILCQGTGCNPNKQGCEINGIFITSNEVKYYLPMQCSNTPGAPDCVPGVLNARVLCKTTQACQCNLVGGVWTCQTQGAVTNTCKTIDVGADPNGGQLPVCSYTACP